MDKRFYFLLMLIVTSTFMGCDRKVKTADNSVNQNVSDISNTPKNELKGIEFLKFAYSDIMKDSTKNHLDRQVLINDSITLIHIIEPILFDIFGEKEIISERPYEVHLFGDNWLAMGTLPKDYLGGTFEVIINRKTCEIIHLSHGK